MAVSMLYRRRATPEELQEGERQMRLAQQRLQAAVDAPIEDALADDMQGLGRGDGIDEQGPLAEQMPGFPLRGGDGIEGQGPQAEQMPGLALQDRGPLAEQTPGLLQKGRQSEDGDLRLERDLGSGKGRGGQLQGHHLRTPEAPRTRSTEEVRGQMEPHVQLFSYDQLRRLEDLQQQAAWIYGTQTAQASYGVRPADLQREERRWKSEMDKQKDYNRWRPG